MLAGAACAAQHAETTPSDAQLRSPTNRPEATATLALTERPIPRTALSSMHTASTVPTPNPIPAHTPTPAPARTLPTTPTATPWPTPTPTPVPSATPAPTPTPEPLLPQWFPPDDCSGDEVAFTVSPLDPDEISFIVPMGKMSFTSRHVTPTDHMYFKSATFNDPQSQISYDVRAAAKGQITSIRRMTEEIDYQLIIWHSCTISTIYIHLEGLAPEIREVIGDLAPRDPRQLGDSEKPIPVEAGQLIGTAGGSFDFSVQDKKEWLNFVVPEHYFNERFKMYTVDPFDYFTEPLRSQLLEKNVRKVEPFGGKIDFDIDGRLVGNWFFEGSNYWQPYGVFAHLSLGSDGNSGHQTFQAEPVS